jgi:energy-coupling factor transport system permease protein
VIYRRRASPLHAARAAAGCAYCAALATISLVASSPFVLAAALVAVVAAGTAAGVGRELRRAAWIAVPLGLLIASINPIVDHNGLTVVARAGTVPWLGQLDITLEAVVYGLMLGLRAVVLIEVFALYSAAVDPDEVLRLFRRVSYRSALTAVLATRMVPVLARDARRMAEAQRCRPARPAPRLALVRALAGGALDRAVDVAATLEVRGYGSARRPPRIRRPWSRHDFAFGGAAAGLLALVVGAGLAGVAAFDPYPALQVDAGPAEALLSLAIVALALAPFAGRRGIVR